MIARIRLQLVLALKEPHGGGRFADHQRAHEILREIPCFSRTAQPFVQVLRLRLHFGVIRVTRPRQKEQPVLAAAEQLAQQLHQLRVFQRRSDLVNLRIDLNLCAVIQDRSCVHLTLHHCGAAVPLPCGPVEQADQHILGAEFCGILPMDPLLDRLYSLGIRRCLCEFFPRQRFQLHRGALLALHGLLLPGCAGHTA